METLVLIDLQRLTYISTVQIRDAVWITSQEQWKREREGGDSVLPARLDDGDIYTYISRFKIIYYLLLDAPFCNQI